MQGRTLISSFLRHPNAANLLMALLLLFGVFGLLRINSQFFPTIESPNVTISVTWSGAAAADIESGILNVVEPAVRFIDGLKELRSTAREGGAYVTLEFEEGTNLDKAVAEVETAVKAITTLPEGADEPSITRSQFFDSVARMSISGAVPEAELRNWAHAIRDELISRGIDRVTLTGARAFEIDVLVSPAALERHGLTIEDVSRIIGAKTVESPSGALDGGVERQLRIVSASDDLQRLAGIEIRTLPDGGRLLLGDLASLFRVPDRAATQGFVTGQRAIEVEVSRAPTADTLETASIFRTYASELRDKLPESLTLQVYDVRADQLSDRIWLLINNGASGLLVVLIVLFIFLDRRIAFWVAAGIPVAMMATFGILFLLGETINMFSLFALIMMLGVIVDDAIVVGEHTATRLAMGDDPVTAAENGVGMMMMPVIAAMTTTLAAFFPMLLITGTIGQIMVVIPIVVIAIILASLIECLFILPGHLAHAMQASREPPRWSHLRQIAVGIAAAAGISIWASASAASSLASSLQAMPLVLRALVIGMAALALASVVEWALLAGARRRFARDGGDIRNPSGFRGAFDRTFEAFKNGPYNAIVTAAYDWRYVTIALSVGLMLAIGIGLVRGQHVRFVFFPSAEAERVTGRIEMNAGIPQADALKIVRAAEEALLKAEQKLAGDDVIIAATFTRLGVSGRDRGDNFAEIVVQLVPSEQRTVRTPDLTRKWREIMPDLPGIRRFSPVEARGGPPGRDVDLQLVGKDAATLKTAARELIDRLALIPGVAGATDDLPYGKPELILSLMPRGAALGLTIEDVGRQVRANLDGVVARRFTTGGEDIAVRVRRDAPSSSLGALQTMSLKLPGGGFVALADAVTIREQQGFAKIERINGEARVSVTSDVDTAVATTDTVLGELRDSGFLDDLAARHGVEVRFGGRAQEQRQAFRDVGIGTAISLGVIYIILAWVFGSYSRPVAVMLIIPFGYLGAVFGHWLLGFDLTILSMIGLLGLAGILVNDSIILVVRNDERLAEGDSPRSAAIGASRDRLRAVLLTSLTTIGGLAPLLFETSLQAQFLLPMAITMVFGLAIATLLVLFLVPALLGIGQDAGSLLRRVYGIRDEPRPLPGPAE
jgi:multidrug efflux pump subunit AcrB